MNGKIPQIVADIDNSRDDSVLITGLVAEGTGMCDYKHLLSALLYSPRWELSSDVQADM